MKNERFALGVANSPSIACTVIDVVLRGPFVEYILEAVTKARIITVQPKRPDMHAIGAEISLTWDANLAHIFAAEG
ncbi:TOBE domain-containing protein [Cypionkella sp. TWP1-2-1b2]|uniref:TOBE domain-containing protein n=1 Tax=Cypionkella sp. TWP1-2-1b2 TaxID=2804675 RepID=UPI003CF2BE77